MNYPLQNLKSDVIYNVDVFLINEYGFFKRASWHVKKQEKGEKK
jgi:hypothetical protein